MREFLDRELNANLINVASIQAASVTDEPSGAMRFHEWELTPEEATQIRELNRFAQVWSAEGESLLRSQFVTEDLPLDTTALRQASAGNLVIVEQEYLDMPIRSLYYPLERLGPLHAHHVLQVAAPLEGRNEMLAWIARVLTALTAVVGLATFGGGWWLARRMVKPVNEIIDQAESMEAQTLHRRIDAHADAQEYARLVRVLNTMLARLDHAFEAQRRFTADASHELRGPLTALRGEIELALRRERDEEEYRRVLASNLQEVERLTQLAEDLLTLARSDAGVMQPRLQRTDVLERAEHVLGRLEGKAAGKDVELRIASDGDTEGIFDPGLLDQLLWNLVDNAVKFTPSGGRVRLSLDGDADAVEIRVADTGPGLPPEDVDRIFERFYRADRSRTHHAETSGTGLGLSIVRAIAKVHGGRARAGNRPEGGAEFVVRLPRAP
ncbi:MAG: HAMP domain-containing protein [Gemmatimonadetes bacterium]|nr:HAMP domain-containing protein [Gemmatimonadota bacterium]NIQ58133.1 HAMP domain-containing protein [Gemmatimonadota bacterium]NIU78337.1 HAMP domain-containing protein [Gammaproteobacteria bacterium]NIX47284.1 HAMP domain-containing protein [Gemmatimonadota bacterium]NIY11661.1 HAMP domain-containing protein [Gemmatimonadota bacterium]